MVMTGATFDIRDALIARREHELAKIAQECETTTAVLETFMDGGKDPPDEVLIRVTEYLFQGLKRFHPYTDTLVSTQSSELPPFVAPEHVPTLQIDYSKPRAGLIPVREARNGAGDGTAYTGGGTVLK